MAWTLASGIDDIIELRAIIDTKTQQDEIRKLIAALEKRLTKEPADDRPAATDV